MSAARYNNIPRFDLTTVDGNLIALADRPLTESVLIIGPALDGPTDRALAVSSLADVENVYGPVLFDTNYLGPNGETKGWSGNALVKALREAQSGGAGDIRLLRVATGNKAVGTFTQAAVFNSGASGTITLSGKSQGRLYNQTSVTFTSGSTSATITISQPVVKGGSFSLTLNAGSSGTTIGELVDALNSDPRNRTVDFVIGTVAAASPARVLNGAVTLAGGTDGTVKDDMVSIKTRYYTALTDAGSGVFNDFLADADVDNVHLAGIYLDDQVDPGDTTKSVAIDFSQFLAKRTVDNPMIGVIGVRPLNTIGDRSNIITHYNALLNTAAGNRGSTSDRWLNAGYFMRNGFVYSDGTLDQPIDAGGYLQVVAADVMINDSELGLYLESAAGIYTGLLSSLKPQRAATHKPIQGIYGLPYEFTRAQLDSLSAGVGTDRTTNTTGGGAYVTARRIEGKGILFTRDVTAAGRNSDFKDLQPLRIANAVHKGIKDIAFPFLGEPNSIPLRNSLQTQIKSFLDGLADADALLGKEGVGYTFRLRGGDTPLSMLLGILDIDITLRPALQVKGIRVRIRLSL